MSAKRSDNPFVIRDGVLVSFRAKKKRDVTSVTIPSEVKTIGPKAFSWAQISEVVFTENLESIERDAFAHCYNLGEIVLPDSLKKLDDFAFFDCGMLEKIVLPKNLEYIGDDVIGWTEVTEIEIPDTVSYINPEAFASAYHLSRVNVDESNEHYKSVDGNLYTKDGKTLMFVDRKATDFDFEEGVEEIANYALRLCKGLEFVVVPESVTKIGRGAFSGCSGLTNLIIEADVTSIEDYTFAECYSLYDACIDTDIETIGKGAFKGCVSLKDIDLPFAKSIGDEAFCGCTSLESVYFKHFGQFTENLKKIGKRAFRGCVSLKSVYWPCTLQSIGEEAFYGCVSLNYVNLPFRVKRIKTGTFYGCTSLQVAELPEKLKSIGDRAFYGCASLGSVSIPESTMYIGRNAFSGCDLFLSIYFEDPHCWICAPYGVFPSLADSDVLEDRRKNYEFMVTGDGAYGMEKLPPIKKRKGDEEPEGDEEE